MSNKDLELAVQIIIMAIVISVILLFLGIGLLVLIHAFIIGRSSRNSSRNEREDLERRNRSQEELQKLPSYDFTNSKGSSPIDCAVCLDNFKIGDKCRLLPICNHSFHSQCVDSWLLRTPICPICRTSTFSDSRRQESSNFSDSVDVRGSLSTDSNYFSDLSIDQLREGQPSMEELRQNEGEESNQENSNGGMELIHADNQINLVVTQLNQTNSLDSTCELPL
ncbi:RING-H2 finger protein ATL74-like [Jatropha curcas]|uniref:RING-H2 finger protein ATL74-like n=1 Tax=Jatropha curcas TaxID=180498 RepID=UPI0009D74F69|nr:RING-H2 finger protein ATL74-like [Jatropha curcas]